MKALPKLAAGLSILLLTSFISASTAPDAVIVETSYLIGKQKAEDLGLPYLVHFTADWCTACNWMEETALKDEGVIERLNHHYVFIRVNVEEFEGYSLKKFYDIGSLPTLLVFSSDHRLLERIENSIPKNELAGLLDKYLTGAGEEIGWENGDTDAVNRELPPSDEAAQAVRNNAAGPPVAEPEGGIARAAWRIQLGAFGSHANASEKLEEAKKLFREPCQIVSESRGDGFLYRVYTGKFESEKAAEQFLQQIRSMGLDGMVKKVSLTEKT